MMTFWNAVESLPGGATDRREWRRLLGDRWTACESFLVFTGRIAQELSCPNPGGEHCPRKIIRHEDETVRAICGDRMQWCADLNLSQHEIEVLEIDRQKLTGAIAGALDLQPSQRPQKARRIVLAGRYLIQSSYGFPIYVSFPDPQSPISANDIAGLDGGGMPFVLLVPGHSSIAAEARQMLDRVQGRAILLEDAVGLSPTGRLAPVVPSSLLFDRELKGIAALMTYSVARPLITLPPGAGWSEITITFIAGEAVNIAYGQEMPRRFEPAHLGLMDSRTGKANQLWVLLKTFALAGGKLPVNPPREIPGYQKRKQNLSAALKRTFGIAEEPIIVADGMYQTVFRILGDGLSQGRQGQRPTKNR